MMTKTEAKFKEANVPKLYWAKTVKLGNYMPAGAALTDYTLRPELDADLDAGISFHLHGLGRERVHLLPAFTRALVLRGKSVYYATAQHIVRNLSDIEYEDFLDQRAILCIDMFNDTKDTITPFETRMMFNFEEYILDRVHRCKPVFTSGSKRLLESGWWTNGFLHALADRQSEIQVGDICIQSKA